MIKDTKIKTLLTSEQLTNNEDEELFIMRVPVSIDASSLIDIDFNLKSPERITVQDKVFSPIIDKDVKSSTVVVVPDEKGKFGVQSIELKGIISLRESVIVPPLPKLEIPPDSKVAPPPPLVTRHPIYGREAPSKRIIDEGEIKIEEDQEEPVKKKKKKKDKKHKQSEAQ